jgi:dephospho-CoA kinase
MKKPIVIINGAGGCGKDSFVNMCNEFLEVKNASTVDKVKEAYKLLGWGDEKTEEDRKNLSDIKDLSTRRFDHPYKYISQVINRFNAIDIHEILFIHSREPSEIDRFRNIFDCVTLLIRNPNIQHITSNHADADVEKYEYDYVIDNDGTLDDLRKKAKEFVNSIRA